MPKRAGVELAAAVRKERLPLCDGKFTLTATGVHVKGRPSIEEFGIAWRFARFSEQGSPWWVVALLEYAETRNDWDKGLLEKIVDLTGKSEGRVRSLRSIGRSIPPARRRDDVDFSVHEVVAPLEPEEQDELLEQAAVENLSVRDVKTIIRGRRRQRVISGQAVLEGQFRVIYADPPWSYRTTPPSGVDPDVHYPTMTIEEICALPVQEHSFKDSVLFMWTTAPKLLENPGPRDVLEAWGFDYKTNVVWDKVTHNFGHYFSVRHEHLIIATRGRCTPECPTPMPDSVQTFRGGRAELDHSEKPEEFRKLIERLYPTGPHLELFGRKKVDGWTVVGNDARLWAGEMERAS